MDEEIVSALIEAVEQGYEDIQLLQAKLPQFGQVLEQAKKSQQWDLVMKAAYVCPYEYIHLSMWHAKNEGKELSKEERINIWQQMRDLSVEGLKAARRLEDQKQEEIFLFKLARFSTSLGEYEQSLNYLRQRLRLTPQQYQYAEVGREAYFHGQRANTGGDYVTARALYQLCLDLMDPENKGGIANVLDFMVVNEMDAGNRELARKISERCDKIREESRASQ